MIERDVRQQGWARCWAQLQWAPVCCYTQTDQTQNTDLGLQQPTGFSHNGKVRLHTLMHFIVISKLCTNKSFRASARETKAKPGAFYLVIHVFIYSFIKENGRYLFNVLITLGKSRCESTEAHQWITFVFVNQSPWMTKKSIHPTSQLVLIWNGAHISLETHPTLWSHWLPPTRLQLDSASRCPAER